MMWTSKKKRAECDWEGLHSVGGGGEKTKSRLQNTKKKKKFIERRGGVQTEKKGHDKLKGKAKSGTERANRRGGDTFNERAARGTALQEGGGERGKYMIRGGCE